MLAITNQALAPSWRRCYASPSVECIDDGNLRRARVVGLRSYIVGAMHASPGIARIDDCDGVALDAGVDARAPSQRGGVAWPSVLTRGGGAGSAPSALKLRARA
jgi:hypothetical protein